jgi:nitrite reductase/ring-hydroxylating ferredoxin subunit
MTVAYGICATSDIPNRRGRAFSLLRVDEDKVKSAVNRRPHGGVNLDWEANQFLEPGSSRVVCGKHGSQFELATGKCLEGPCMGQSLEPINLVAIDGDICVTGVTLTEDAA